MRPVRSSSRYGELSKDLVEIIAFLGDQPLRRCIKGAQTFNRGIVHCAGDAGIHHLEAMVISRFQILLTEHITGVNGHGKRNGVERSAEPAQFRSE